MILARLVRHWMSRIFHKLLRPVFSRILVSSAAVLTSARTWGGGGAPPGGFS